MCASGSFAKSGICTSCLLIVAMMEQLPILIRSANLAMQHALNVTDSVIQNVLDAMMVSQ